MLHGSRSRSFQTLLLLWDWEGRERGQYGTKGGAGRGGAGKGCATLFGVGLSLLLRVLLVVVGVGAYYAVTPLVHIF